MLLYIIYIYYVYLSILTEYRQLQAEKTQQTFVTLAENTVLLQEPIAEKWIEKTCFLWH